MQEQLHHLYYPWNVFMVRHHFYPKAILDLYLLHSKSVQLQRRRISMCSQSSQLDYLVIDLSPKSWTKNNFCIGIIQENLIKSSLQNSLPYILLQMIYANYCALYPKWPCIKHKANMWCPYCMTLFCSRTFYFLLLSPVIYIMTTSSDVTDHF